MVDLTELISEPPRRDGDEECTQEEDVLIDVSGLRVVLDAANCGSIGLVHLVVKMISFLQRLCMMCPQIYEFHKKM